METSHVGAIVMINGMVRFVRTILAQIGDEGMASLMLVRPAASYPHTT